MRRRCAACRQPLPAGASARKVYCGNACVAKAYRARRRRERATRITRNVTWAYAVFVRQDLTEAEVEARFMVVDEVRCPMCGTVTWPGVRHRPAHPVLLGRVPSAGLSMAAWLVAAANRLTCTS
ncbi:MAG: hypothetical protein ACRDRH_21400 [Pseudonocardia sp.]